MSSILSRSRQTLSPPLPPPPYHGLFVSIYSDVVAFRSLNFPGRNRMPLNMGTKNEPKTKTPVHGAQTPMHGSQTPMHGSQTPMHGSQTPMHGSQTPVHGSQTPLHGSQTPLHGNQTPLGAGNQTPVGAGGQTPLHGSQTPLHGSQTPLHGRGGETPVDSWRDGRDGGSSRGGSR